MYRTFFLALLVVHNPLLSLFAENTLRVESRSALSGATEVEVKIFADIDDGNTETDLQIIGISFAASFDDELTINRIEPGAAVAGFGEVTEGNEFPWNSPGWLFYPIEQNDYFAVAMITDFPDNPDDTGDLFETSMLSEGTDQHLLSVFFDISPQAANGSSLQIDLRDGLSSPAIRPVFSDTNGATNIPALADGTISVVTAPVITDINKHFAPLSGSLQFIITGENLTEDTEITIGGNDVENETFDDSNTMRGTFPAHAAGTVSVTITNPIGSDTLDDAVTYVNTPTITSITPNRGLGDEYVTIRGTNFTDENDLDILLNFNTNDDFTIISDTEISCYLPACSAGSTISIWITTCAGIAKADNGYICGEVTDATFRRGDGNCDSNVDLSDVVTILSYLFASYQANCLAAFDTNNDDSVDISDAVFMLSYLFASGSEPAAPFPDLGTDPNSTPGCETQCGS